jgi:tetratricopeptide (TPR) repeat protein
LKEERRIIYLQEGLIVSASSSNPQDFFGEFLCNKGFISNMQLKEALSYAKAKDLRLGNAVVQLQMIKPDILYPLLQEQLKNIVNRPFAWEKGNYFFLPNEKNHQDESIFKIPVNQCIYEGIKKNYSEQRLQKYFNGKDLLIQPNPNFSDHLSELILENKEKEFMKLLNVPRRMNELTQLSILPPKEILQLCFILQTIGICSTVDARTIANKPVVIVEKKMPLSNLATPMDLKSEKTEVPKTVEFSKPTIHLPETPPKNFSYGSFISGAISCGIILIGVYFGLHRHNSKKTILAVAREPAQCTTVVEKNLSEKSIVEKDASPAINSVALTLAIPPVAPKIESQKTAKPVLATAAVVNKSDQFESFLKQGKVYYKSGDLIRAKDFFLKALLLNPASSEVLIQLANLSYDMDNETDAMSYINRVLKNDGNNPDARQLLGSIYLMNSRNADAINQFKIVLKYSKDSKRKIEIEKILAKLSSK